MSDLKIKGLSKSYADTNVLDNLNLEVDKAEFLVLLGPSGSGKSTLARIIAGLEKPDSGDIQFNGKSLLELAPKDRDLAMVFQNYALYPHKTVFENIAFPLEIADFSKTEINKLVNLVAVDLELEHLLDRKPKQLSGGQRQRVALARALVKQPKIFLFDEPLSNLDAKLRLQMRNLLSKLHKTLGKIFIYVTHDQVEALSLATKIAVLDQGHIRQIASPEKIYRQPADTFVASFIGSPPCNILDIEGEEYLLGIRPENIFLEKQDKANMSLEAEFQSIEYSGNEYIMRALYMNQTISVRLSTERILNPLIKEYIHKTPQKSRRLTLSLYFGEGDMCYFNRRNRKNVGE